MLRKGFVVSKGKKMADWQPIESAPQGPRVIVYGPDGVTVASSFNGCWSDDLNEDEPIFPSHWMMLPVPPKVPRS